MLGHILCVLFALDEAARQHAHEAVVAEYLGRPDLLAARPDGEDVVCSLPLASLRCLPLVSLITAVDALIRYKARQPREAIVRCSWFEEK